MTSSDLGRDWKRGEELGLVNVCQRLWVGVSVDTHGLCVSVHWESFPTQHCIGEYWTGLSAPGLGAPAQLLRPQPHTGLGSGAWLEPVSWREGDDRSTGCADLV